MSRDVLGLSRKKLKLYTANKNKWVENGNTCKVSHHSFLQKATRYSASIILMYDLPTYLPTYLPPNPPKRQLRRNHLLSNSSPPAPFFLSLTYMHVVIQKGIFFLLPRLSLLNLLFYTKVDPIDSPLIFILVSNQNFSSIYIHL